MEDTLEFQTLHNETQCDVVAAPSYWALWFLRAVFCSYDPIFLSSIRVLVLVVTLLTGVILLVAITVVVVVVVILFLIILIFIILRFSFVVAVVGLKQS